MPFKFEHLSIPDVIVITPTVYQDERGTFMESYKCSEFAAAGIPERFVQDNRSKSAHAVLRGLHYQKIPKAQGKLIQVAQGEIFDVAVDIRHGSPTYGKWVGMRLSARNAQMLYLPVGFAHGCCVLSETAEVTYKVTVEYSPEHEAGIVWDDPDLAIAWPILHPILSKKDADYPRLKGLETGFVFGETA
jgi:dTDP-4-dehydrorhamnose 3,5-epimerase